MAYFVLTYRYADQDARARNREEHLAYLNGLHAEGKVVLAGPVGDGGGALVVYKTADHDEAAALVEGDPYTREGVTSDRELRTWRVAVPAPPA